MINRAPSLNVCNLLSYDAMKINARKTQGRTKIVFSSQWYWIFTVCVAYLFRAIWHKIKTRDDFPRIYIYNHKTHQSCSDQCDRISYLLNSFDQRLGSSTRFPQMWAGPNPEPDVLRRLHEFVVGSQRCSEGFLGVLAFDRESDGHRFISRETITCNPPGPREKQKNRRSIFPASEGVYLEYFSEWIMRTLS